MNIISYTNEVGNIM